MNRTDTPTGQISMFGVGEMMKAAELSPDGRYRYALYRTWDQTLPGRSLWIMLNPSTADAELDDPTIRRCIGFSKGWGHGALAVVNLFAWRATDPKELRQVADPVGPDNDRHLVAALEQRPSMVICAWGQPKNRLMVNRVAAVHQNLAAARHRGLLQRFTITCLGHTDTGAPKHPLYLRADQATVTYQAAEAG